MDSFHTGPEFISGMRTYMGGNRDSSLKTLSDLLAKNPNDASLHVLLGNLEYSQGTLSQSAEHYVKALAACARDVPGVVQARRLLRADGQAPRGAGGVHEERRRRLRDTRHVLLLDGPDQQLPGQRREGPGGVLHPPPRITRVAPGQLLSRPALLQAQRARQGAGAPRRARQDEPGFRRGALPHRPGATPACTRTSRPSGASAGRSS